MRVPLDFYRILGVPHQITPNQLQQAYRDRLLQLPRYHYSDGAIAARKQLLEAAYIVLSDPNQRQDYDANFLATVYAPSSLADPHASEVTEPEISGINIQDHQLAGALLLLQELGEYELVLKLGRPYLSNGILELKYSRLGSILSEADIVLSVALAYLELGREQWQQNQYEKAAQSLKDGLDLLLREGLFSDVQSEIRTDLYKLRPYRILELLALPSDKDERSQGFLLLRDMLTERGGIDGTGSDQSGLGIDDFLQFIQQLRRYLTIAEQRELFEAEASRPSAVATYLAVYTLLAQGFTQYQPALIRRARATLSRLSSHQDVYLEQATCALLLGQTEDANQALELSQEYEAIAFIRDYSEGSPDLIPGLCLYTQRWLQDEVFPYFRDLADQQADLKAYFADWHVQTYLEELAAEKLYSSTTKKDAAVVQPSTGDASKQAAPTRSTSTPASSRIAVDNQASPSFRTANPEASHIDTERQSATVRAVSTQENRSRQSPQTQFVRPVTPDPSPAVNRSIPSGLSNGSGLYPSESSLPPPATPLRERAVKRRRPQWLFGAPRNRGSQGTADNRVPSRVKGQSTAAKVRQKRSPNGNTSGMGSRRPSRSSRRRRPTQVVGLILLSLLGVGVVAAIAVDLIRRSQPPVLSPGTQEEPLIQLDRPPLPIPTPSSLVSQPNPTESNPQIAPAGPLTKETVEQLVQTWQSLKAEALGSRHASDQLSQVLTGPALSQWRARAEADKATDQYWQYKLNRLSVDELELIGSNQAKAKVTISETADLFNQGRPQKAAAYADTYQVRYDIVRQEGRWLIRAMEVL